MINRIEEYYNIAYYNGKLRNIWSELSKLSWKPISFISFTLGPGLGLRLGPLGLHLGLLGPLGPHLDTHLGLRTIDLHNQISIVYLSNLTNLSLICNT